MLFDTATRLSKTILAGVISVIVANFFAFLGMVTPAWQVADDTDVNRYVQSGLWLYCQTGAQCWYIFSDNLINYYERVDVCRFLLIGDCRKKLLRTPYFFGWHYATLILITVALAFGVLAIVAGAYGYFKKTRLRITTIIFDCCVFMEFILMGIAIAVFSINAEMLESKYLIGVRNTFEKEYGYSFFLVCFALFILCFSSLTAILLTTFVFFGPDARMITREQEYEKSQYMERPDHYPQTMYTAETVRSQHSPSSILKTPLQEPPLQRSVTPVSFAPSSVGQFIAPSYDRTGGFQPTTRHYLSY
ncbi:unnamed protein product, partial [Mesorhabditis belari]|uniref:Clc-like protein 5 n=1 Tax=Mesorhabditis belari TaxID=2138241 RepID=A0AAF3EEJ0_9BILA